MSTTTGSTPLDETGSVGGVVKDGAGKRMAGVKVTTLGASVTTGEDGSYTLWGLPPGSYTVRELPPAGYAQSGATSLVVTMAAGSSSIEMNGARPVPGPIITMGTEASSGSRKPALVSRTVACTVSPARRLAR